MAPKYDTTYFELCTFVAEDHAKAKAKRVLRMERNRTEQAKRLREAIMRSPSLARAINDYARREKIW